MVENVKTERDFTGTWYDFQLLVDFEITFQIKVPTWPTSPPWHCYMLLLTPCVSISVPRRPNRISAGESLDIWNDSISPNRSARDQDPAPLTLRPCWRSWFFKNVEDFDGFCQSSIDRQWPALQVFKVFLQINLSMPVRLLSVLMPDRLLSYHGSRAERAEQWWFKWDEDTKIRRCHSCHWWFRHRFWGAKACIVRLLALKQFACAIFCAKSRAISVLHRELIWKPIDQWAFQQKRLKCFVLRRGKDFRSRMWQLMTSGYKMIQVSKTNTNDNTWNSWHLLVRLAVTWVFGYFQMSSSLQPTFICQVRFVPQSSRLMAALYWQASSAQKGSKNHLKNFEIKVFWLNATAFFIPNLIPKPCKRCFPRPLRCWGWHSRILVWRWRATLHAGAGPDGNLRESCCRQVSFSEFLNQ